MSDEKGRLGVGDASNLENSDIKLIAERLKMLDSIDVWLGDIDAELDRIASEGFSGRKLISSKLDRIEKLLVVVDKNLSTHAGDMMLKKLEEMKE
jgi:hypothetical protein